MIRGKKEKRLGEFPAVPLEEELQTALFQDVFTWPG